MLDLEKTIRWTYSSNSLMWAFMVVVLYPEVQPLSSIFKAVKLSPQEEFLKNSFPESLDFSESHRMVRLAFDMLDTVFFKLFFELGCATPVGILAPIVRKHFFWNSVLS
jgi:hypothetical protein